MSGGKNPKQIVLSLGVFLFGLYRMGAPFMEETARMKKEAAKLSAEIQQIRLEAINYDKAWEERMEQRDRTVRSQLPDRLNSSDVLDYFITQFEKNNAGNVKFLSVSQSGISVVNFGKGSSKPDSLPRTAKYKLQAQLHQGMLVPYIEHIERYSGLFRLTDFSFAVDREIANVLRMEMALEYFLAPKDWVPPDKLAQLDEEDEDQDDRVQPWRQIFVSQQTQKEVEKRAPAVALKPTGRPKKLPVVSKIVGDSAVIDESLYEEGDNVGGWKVLKIDPRSKTVTLKSGNVTKTVVAK